MDREYDLFERLPDGSIIWRDHTSGLTGAALRLRDIAKSTSNECLAVHLSSGETVARMSLRASGDGRPTLVLFQIAYDETLAEIRSDLLRKRAYEVTTVLGNEAAKAVLALPQRWDLFIVGAEAPGKSQTEMVAWLSAKYPNVPILVLTPGEVRELASANYNAASNAQNHVALPSRCR